MICVSLLQNSSLCSSKNQDCVSSIKAESSEFLQECSGILVISYEQQEIEDMHTKLAQNLLDKLTQYLSNSGLSYYFGNMANEVQGFVHIIEFQGRKIRFKVTIASCKEL